MQTRQTLGDGETNLAISGLSLAPPCARAFEDSQQLEEVITEGVVNTLMLRVMCP